MKAYTPEPVKSTSVRRKPVSKSNPSLRRKPVSPRNADTVISPVIVAPSIPETLTTTVSPAKQDESTSTTTPEDRTHGGTSETTVEVPDAAPNCEPSKLPSHPYFSDESFVANVNGPQISTTDRDFLERTQTAPVQMEPVQFFTPQEIDDRKRRRRKAIRNGVVMYVTFIS